MISTAYTSIFPNKKKNNWYIVSLNIALVNKNYEQSM